MALLTTQVILRPSLTPTYGAVAASDTFVPGADVFLHVKNAGGSSDTVTVAVVAGDPGTGLTIADISVAVPATTGDRMIGPLPAQFFADPTTGLATVTHSFTTSVTAAVLKLQQP
jgi:hypothetical protein